MPVAKAYRTSPFYHGTQNDAEFANEAERRSKPWTEAELLRVKDMAFALVRTHRGDGLVDGHALWDLMGALDRVRGREAD